MYTVASIWTDKKGLFFIVCRKAKTMQRLISFGLLFFLADAVRLVGAVGAVLGAVAELLEADARQVGHAEQFSLRALGAESGVARTVAEQGILDDLGKFIVTVSLCEEIGKHS